MQDLILGYITWDPDPNAFTVFGWPIRWYGIFYALSFIVGHWVLRRAFMREYMPGRSAADINKDVDALTIAVILGIIVGARLGHVFFYSGLDSEYYAKPWTILYIWEGGLASHGAVIGIAIAVWFYARKRKGQTFLTTSDKLMYAVGFGSCMIRLGNLLNSEIVGHPSDLPWAFHFIRGDEPAYAPPGPDGTPGAIIARHPVVLYEAICYMLLFLSLLAFQTRIMATKAVGLTTGIFLTALFSIRFTLEFFKTKQEEYDPLIEGLTTGQLLSIPAVLVGIAMIYLSFRNRKKPASPTS